MPKGYPKSGVNKGWIKKGQKLALGVACSEDKKVFLHNLWTGKPLSETHRKNISKSLIGNTRGLGIPHIGSGGHKQDIETRKRISATLSIVKTGVPIYKARGKNNHNWKGGVTPIHQQIRQSLEYKNWRREVFNRDDYTCQKCGQVSGNIEAHHIKPFAFFPELRFTISNGVTLCHGCHQLTDTYRLQYNITV